MNGKRKVTVNWHDSCHIGRVTELRKELGWDIDRTNDEAIAKFKKGVLDLTKKEAEEFIIHLAALQGEVT